MTWRDALGVALVLLSRAPHVVGRIAAVSAVLTAAAIAYPLPFSYAARLAGWRWLAPGLLLLALAAAAIRWRDHPRAGGPLAAALVVAGSLAIALGFAVLLLYPYEVFCGISLELSPAERLPLLGPLACAAAVVTAAGLGAGFALDRLGRRLTAPDLVPAAADLRAHVWTLQAGLVLLFVHGALLPALVRLFEEVGVALPAPVEALLAIRDLVQRHALVGLGRGSLLALLLVTPGLLAAGAARGEAMRLVGRGLAWASVVAAATSVLAVALILVELGRKL